MMNQDSFWTDSLSKNLEGKRGSWWIPEITGKLPTCDKNVTKFTQKHEFQFCLILLQVPVIRGYSDVLKISRVSYFDF